MKNTIVGIQVDNRVVVLFNNSKDTSKKHIARITLGELCDKFDETDVKKMERQNTGDKK